jgi:hypothetical protein
MSEGPDTAGRWVVNRVWCVRALAVARQSDAGSWGLRVAAVAASLPCLWLERSRRGSDRELLSPPYDRFTKRFNMSDPVNANALLDGLDCATAVGAITTQLTGRLQLPSRFLLFQPFPITLPIAFLANMTIAPRLVLQAVGLVGIDRRRILAPFTMGRHRFAAHVALLL